MKFGEKLSMSTDSEGVKLLESSEVRSELKLIIIRQ